MLLTKEYSALQTPKISIVTRVSQMTLSHVGYVDCLTESIQIMRAPVLYY